MKPKPKRTNLILPPQRGRIIGEGKAALSFWVRTFGLEEQTEAVRQRLMSQEQDPKILATVLISAEHRVNPNLIFIYLVAPIVDMIGICDGTAIVYFASPEYEEEALRSRDKFTKESMATAEQLQKLREIQLIQPSKEP